MPIYIPGTRKRATVGIQNIDTLRGTAGVLTFSRFKSGKVELRPNWNGQGGTVTAHVEVRSQKAAGKWPKIGPDKYVAVQLVPQGVEPLTQLRQDTAKKRGIEIVRFGEG